MYYTKQFVHCCTAMIMYDFPFDHNPPKTFSGLKKQVGEKLKEMYLDGDGTCVVTLVNGQSKSIEVLKEMGFHCSEPMSKKRHVNTLLHVLYIDLQEYYKDNCAAKTPKRDAKGRFISNNPFNKPQTVAATPFSEGWF